MYCINLQAHGVIYVVDSSDYERMEEARDVLHNLVSHSKISGKPLIILANKQDNDDALDEIDLIEKLQLEDLVNNQQCPTLVESCAATEVSKDSKVDPGIQKAYYWLLNYIIRDYNNLDIRVQADVKVQEQLESEIRLETMKRIRLQQESEKNADDDVIELYSDYNKKLNGINLSSATNSAMERILSSDDSSPRSARVSEETKQDRPKSAVQMVKEQLQLEQTQRKTPKISSSSNKTAPVSLYNAKLPRSANSVGTREPLSDPRNLKSAGDSIFVIANLPNSVNSPTDCGDRFQKDLFHVNNFEHKRKLPPLQNSNVARSHDVSLRDNVNDENVISIVEID